MAISGLSTSIDLASRLTRESRDEYTSEYRERLERELEGELERRAAQDAIQDSIADVVTLESLAPPGMNEGEGDPGGAFVGEMAAATRAYSVPPDSALRSRPSDADFSFDAQAREPAVITTQAPSVSREPDFSPLIEAAALASYHARPRSLDAEPDLGRLRVRA